MYTPEGGWREWACGLLPVCAAAWVYGAGWAANATWPSECGNCRRDLAAQHGLLWGEVPWLLAASVAASFWATGRGRRVARCGTAVGLAVWAASVWLGRGWWW